MTLGRRPRGYGCPERPPSRGLGTLPDVPVASIAGGAGEPLYSSIDARLPCRPLAWDLGHIGRRSRGLQTAQWKVNPVRDAVIGVRIGYSTQRSPVMTARSSATVPAP